MVDDNIDVYCVSGGWMFVVNCLFNKNININNLIFYDINPLMMFLYDLIYKLLLISNTR